MKAVGGDWNIDRCFYKQLHFRVEPEDPRRFEPNCYLVVTYFKYAKKTIGRHRIVAISILVAQTLVVVTAFSRIRQLLISPGNSAVDWVITVWCRPSLSFVHASSISCVRNQ